MTFITEVEIWIVIFRIKNLFMNEDVSFSDLSTDNDGLIKNWNWMKNVACPL